MFVSVFRYDMFMGDRFPNNCGPGASKVRLGIVYDVCSPLSGGYHLFLADLPAAILLNYFCKWQPEVTRRTNHKFSMPDFFINQLPSTCNCVIRQFLVSYIIFYTEY